MRTTRLLLVASLVASLAGCLVRTRGDGTVVGQTRRCPPSSHWDRDRCVNDRHDRDHDRDRDRDHDRDHDNH